MSSSFAVLNMVYIFSLIAYVGDSALIFVVFFFNFVQLDSAYKFFPENIASGKSVLEHDLFTMR